MRYMYDQMINKYGFDDGNNVPAETLAFRKLMVDIINFKYKDTNFRLVESSTGHNPMTVYWENTTTSEYCEPPEDIYDVIDRLDEKFDISNAIRDNIHVYVHISPNSSGRLISLIKGEDYSPPKEPNITFSDSEQLQITNEGDTQIFIEPDRSILDDVLTMEDDYNPFDQKYEQKKR